MNFYNNSRYQYIVNQMEQNQKKIIENTNEIAKLEKAKLSVGGNSDRVKELENQIDQKKKEQIKLEQNQAMLRHMKAREDPGREREMGYSR